METSPVRTNAGQVESSTLSFGFISLFLVMIVLCLTVFSLLSFSTANSDYKLAKRSSENAAGYYSAERELQKILSSIHSMCTEGKSALQIANEYDTPSAAKEGTINIQAIDNELMITAKINNKQYLEAVLKIADSDYTTKSYLLKTMWDSE